MPQTDCNQVILAGRLDEIRRRWMPDGSLAVVASLTIARPQHGATRASQMGEQPLPLRAQGLPAESLLKFAQQAVKIKGCLRRRYYQRGGNPSWGQVEVWVDDCRPMSDKEVTT